jgi:hypothetical protein
MAGRYYSVEFVDPWGDVFAYVGRRTTGTQAGDYLISGPDWKGALPSRVTQIVAPNNGVLLIGRVLVEREDDLSTAYGLAKQIQLRPQSYDNTASSAPTSCWEFCSGLSRTPTRRFGRITLPGAKRIRIWTT